MTISREAKILIGIAALALAAWLWINAFNQPAIDSAPPLPLATRPAEPPAPVAPQPPAAEAPTAAAPAPVVPAPSGDARVAELPFLVTEPPAAALEPEVAPALPATERPQELRATVNPFSPILVRASAPTQAAALPEPTIPAPVSDISVVEIPIPTAPDEPVAQVGAGNNGTGSANGANGSAGPPAVSAPLPRALTPEAPAAVSLPRPLPGGILPTTPDILREARSSSPPGPPSPAVDLARVTALRLPDEFVRPTEAPAAFSEVLPEPRPLPLHRSADDIAEQRDPISAGITALSRYLRDNNYRFTGAVIGPVSVGVFRSNASPAPIVVPLGKTLPNTDIVLTNLQGKQAEFTQGTVRYSLVLDRR